MDLWAHKFCDDPKLRDENVDEDYEDELARMEAEAEARAAAEARPARPEAPPPDDDEWEEVVTPP